MATQAIQDILNTSQMKPTDVVKPSPEAPLSSTLKFDRQSKAWTWDPQEQRIVEHAAGVPAYVAEPETGEFQGLLVEEARKQQLTEPNRFDGSGWTASNLSPAGGVAPGIGTTYQAIYADDTSGNAQPRYLKQALSLAQTGGDVSASVIVRPDERDYFYIRLQLNNDPNSRLNVDHYAYFNIQTQEMMSYSGNDGASLNLHNIKPLVQGFVRCKFSLDLDTDWYLNNFLFGPATSNESDIFALSSQERSFDAVHAQVEYGDTCTSPILEGNYTRDSPSLKYDTSQFPYSNGREHCWIFDLIPRFADAFVSQFFYTADSRLEVYKANNRIQLVTNGDNMELSITPKTTAGPYPRLRFALSIYPNSTFLVGPEEEKSIGNKPTGLYDAGGTNIDLVALGANYSIRQISYYPRYISPPTLKNIL